MWGKMRFHVSARIHISKTCLRPLLRERCPHISSHKWISQLHLGPSAGTHYYQMWGHKKVYDEKQMSEVLEYSIPFSILDSPL